MRNRCGLFAVQLKTLTENINPTTHRDRWRDKRRDRQTDRGTDRQRDRQTVRQTETERGCREKKATLATVDDISFWLCQRFLPFSQVHKHRQPGEPRGG